MTSAFRRRQIADAVSMFARPASLQAGTFHVLDAIQKLRPEVQVLSMAVALRIWCEETGLDLSQILHSAQRLMVDVDTPFHSHVPAFRMFVQNEVLG